MAALLVAMILPAAAAAKDKPADCPGIVFSGPKIPLTAAERRLICGDPESEAWKQVPWSQAKGFLTAFLQQRGYHDPVFAVKEERLYVDPGEATVIRRLTGEGLPAGVDLSKRRRIVGAPLTPAMLDKVKAAVADELQNRGYACPHVEMSADASSGAVVARFPGGVVSLAQPIEEPVIDGIDPSIFRRFEAFERARPLNQSLLTITSRRVVSEALFLNSTYDVVCATGGVRIIHRVSSGPPRMIRIGIGIDTEGYARFRARWNHSRIGWRASTSEATIFASKREQSGDARMHLYASPSSRLFLVPRAVAAHSDQPRFDTVTAELSAGPGYTWDDQHRRFELLAGPALEYADTRRGIGPTSSFFQSFKTRAEVLSHPYEYHVREPREGYRAAIETASRVSKLNSSLTAHRVRVETETLWNLGRFDPPFAVLGSRAWAGTTLVGDRETALRELPPAMRFFIGGNADFRGVGPGELGDESGFLTGVYHGLELRAGEVLPYKLQPLIFMDAAMAGRSSASLDPDVYYAPGFGMRWATFIGAFRVTLARSLIWRRDPATLPGPRHWQFFFSYGREF